MFTTIQYSFCLVLFGAELSLAFSQPLQLVSLPDRNFDDLGWWAIFLKIYELLKNEIFRTKWKSFLSCFKFLHFFSKFMTSYSTNVSSQGFLTSFSDFSQPFLGNFRCSGDILKAGKTGWESQLSTKRPEAEARGKPELHSKTLSRSRNQGKRKDWIWGQKFMSIGKLRWQQWGGR